MPEPALDPGEVGELPALQHVGIASREGRPARVDLVEYARFLVEQRDENGVRAANLGQRLQARVDPLFGVGEGDALKVDGDFRAGQVKTRLSVASELALRPADGGLRRFLDESVPARAIIHPGNHAGVATS